MYECPACFMQYQGPAIKMDCDSCGCKFCGDARCHGTIGESEWALEGLGKAINSVCKKCGNGTLKKVK
ncbi:MAG: hypothetical protein CL532_04685 [Aestuariivita sp.]|nr:hypothetical protein [Aestuariivita sp.]